MKRLLIVEDNIMLREAYMELLSNITKVELIVDEASSAPDAIELINNTDYDYIILDGQLTKSHGREVLAVFKNSDKKKVFVSSGDIGFVFEAKKQGFFAEMKSSSFVKNWDSFITQADN